MLIRIVIFIILNFVALGIGGLFTGKGVPSDWYANLAKAPWTPPGWVFGASWTTIMICFALYMSYLWPTEDNKKFLIGLFLIQWILNIMWNPVFFHYHNVMLGLVLISALTLLMGIFLFRFWPQLSLKSLLVLPYFIWLIIATSLNAYIVFNN